MFHLGLPHHALLIMVFVFCFVSPHHACHQLDHEPLLLASSDFRIVSSPLNWSSAIDCCFWEGIHCNTAGRVTRLSLPRRGIHGSFSLYLGNLSYLSHLNLSHNFLTGPNPSSLFSLTSLDTLDLSYNSLYGTLSSFFRADSVIKIVDLSSNHFDGEIQTSFFQHAGKLISLNISNNRFTGHVPSSICSIASQSTRLLDFSYNKFNGKLPFGFGGCSNLQVFRAGYNNLSGPIPNDIFNATALQEISLPFNLLSGSISNDIIQLPNLRILELYNNFITGPIPRDIGKLSSLQYLLLHVNRLTGVLPQSLTNCTNLITVTLRVNSLQGDLSALNFSKLLQLRALDLGHNNFTGRLPHSLYSCKSLTAVRLAANQLEGEILPDILALQFLTFLSLSNNHLTNISGAIKILSGCKSLRTLMLTNTYLNEALPNDESLVSSNGFQSLEILVLGGSQLTGQLPVWLGKLKKLQLLDLSFNQLTGYIPGWLGSLPELFYIDLSNNLISGKIPQDLCRLNPFNGNWSHIPLDLPIFIPPKNMENTLATIRLYNQLSNLKPSIYLGNNSISGNIPGEIGHLKFLHVLDLSHNNLSGTIPDQISQLTNLESLDLSENRLNGEIPASLVGLHFLSSFNVSNNNLQGVIPSGGQFNTFPITSFQGNLGLCGSVTQISCTHKPEIDPPDSFGGSSMLSKEYLYYGLISGAIIGFIIGSSSALLLPSHKLKYLFHEPPNRRETVGIFN